jgi:hypothetical protein
MPMIAIVFAPEQRQGAEMLPLFDSSEKAGAACGLYCALKIWNSAGGVSCGQAKIGR